MYKWYLKNLTVTSGQFDLWHSTLIYFSVPSSVDVFFLLVHERTIWYLMLYNYATDLTSLYPSFVCDAFLYIVDGKYAENESGFTSSKLPFFQWAHTAVYVRKNLLLFDSALNKQADIQRARCVIHGHVSDQKRWKSTKRKKKKKLITAHDGTTTGIFTAKNDPTIRFYSCTDWGEYMGRRASTTSCIAILPYRQAYIYILIWPSLLLVLPQLVDCVRED